MAGKKRFRVENPRGAVIQVKHKDGTVSCRMKWNDGFGPKHEKAFDKRQAFIDQECIRRMNPETPKRSGILIKTATLGTTIGSGEIHQIAPYARRQYYEHREKSLWFEKMKNRHKDSILKGAMQIG